MAVKKPKLKVLDSGEQIIEHPNGDKYLVPGPSALKGALEDAQADNTAAAQALRDVHIEAVEIKRASYGSDPALPHEKRSC